MSQFTGYLPTAKSYVVLNGCGNIANLLVQFGGLWKLLPSLHQARDGEAVDDNSEAVQFPSVALIPPGIHS
jgi:hypothetical protein